MAYTTQIAPGVYSSTMTPEQYQQQTGTQYATVPQSNYPNAQRDPNAKPPGAFDWSNYDAVYGPGGSMEDLGKYADANPILRGNTSYATVPQSSYPVDTYSTGPGTQPFPTTTQQPGPTTTVLPPPPTGAVNPTGMAWDKWYAQNGYINENGFWRDPNTGQYYDSKGQKVAGNNKPPIAGSNPAPVGSGPISDPNLPFTPTGEPKPNLGGFQPNTPPPPPGGTPNVDPYQFGSSPDVSGWFDALGTPTNPQAEPFQYGEVSDFSDAAFQQAMRYLGPQFELDDRRFEQSLINKGLDPNSEAGMEALRRKEVSQNDLTSKAAFDAIRSGTDLQNQMFGQSAARAGLSQELLQALMGLQQRGHEFDTTTGLNANQQAFAQMLALEGLDYRDYQTLIDQMRYDDSLAMALLGLGAPPTYTSVNTGLANAPAYNLDAALAQYNTPLFGG